MDKDFNGYMPPFMDFGMGAPNNMEDPVFNPMMQYEHAYCYYRYLCMQMDYKIKCKEYEKMCGNSPRDREQK